MKAVYWVLPGLLAGRPGPGEVDWDLMALWRGGFRSIACLTGADRPEVPAAGFEYHCVFINGGLAFLPFSRRWLVRQMDPVVDWVLHEISAGRPTLVHCRQGRDRTGAVLAACLVRHQGLHPEEAVARVRQANPQAMISRGFDRLPGLFV